MAQRKRVTTQETVEVGRVSPEVLLANGAALLLLVTSAFAIIYSTHACRELYTRLQELETSQWQLQEDYGRLLLQQSTLASHHKLEKQAREELGMRAPDLARFKVVVQ